MTRSPYGKCEEKKTEQEIYLISAKRNAESLSNRERVFLIEQLYFQAKLIIYAAV